MNIKVFIQKIGSALSSMVMPNIGAFIAWGIITALFIPDGYLPNENLAKMVGPMINYLLPILISYTAGKNIYDIRGGVIATISTMGVIVGAEGTPMFLGAMIMGPIAAILIKYFDNVAKPYIKTGLEMLVNNFSIGILGFLLSIAGFYGIGPIVKSITNILSTGVDIIIQNHLLPLANLFIEPAKVLFLNNAINHGILTPLATEQSLETGKSILFLLEANPGPGLGILLAFMLFGKGSSKSSASGACVIHFFGGIHEIYFPYILMKPLLIIAAMAGGVTGTTVFQFFNSGLKSPASPGSIIAILGMASKDSYLGVSLGVLLSSIVSFVIASIILKSDKNDNIDLEEATSKIKEMKQNSKNPNTTNNNLSSYANIKKIIFACDAGMGSSAMGASILRNKVNKANLNIEVINVAISNLTEEENLIIVTQKELTNRAKTMNNKAIHISVDNFLNSPKYDEIIQNLKNE